MRILIALSGTGGHVYPGLALAERLKEENNEVLLVGRKGGISSRIVEDTGFPFLTIPGEGMVRALSFRQVRFLLKTLQSFYLAMRILCNYRPDVVVGMGGYLSFPIVLMGKMLGAKCLIHEQNVIPGLANRLLARIVDRAMVSFRQTTVYFPEKKTVVTGNPVRQSIVTCSREEGLKNLNLTPGRKTILVFGGSQGAQTINLAMLQALNFLGPLEKKIQIIHITGVSHYPAVKNEYEQKNFLSVVFPFLLHMEYAYSCSDLVVSRAGATTLAEIIARGLPSILIPYPYATGDHQRANARVLYQEGAAILIEDNLLTGECLAEVITHLIDNQEKLDEMGKRAKRLFLGDASARISSLIAQLVRGKVSANV